VTVDLTITEAGYPAQVSLRVAPGSGEAERVAAALGCSLPEPCRLTSAGDRQVLWLGPDELVVVGPERTQDAIADLLTRAIGEGAGAVVDVSGNRLGLVLAGGDARAVLGTCVAFDLRERSFPVGTAVQTMLQKVQVLIVRPSAEELHLYVRPSFAAYLRAWLVDGVESIEIERSAA
jgi:sarcosine oxidase subunit gamma